MIKIYLDGQLIKDPVDGTKGQPIRVEDRDVESGDPSRSYSPLLTFTGDGYNIIYNKLINVPDGGNQKITAKIFDDCCTDGSGNDFLLLEGIVRGDSLEWCDDGKCEVSANIFEETAETLQMDCIQNTLIADDRNGFLSQDHPRMGYCVEYRPSILQDIVIILGIVVNISYAVLLPIVAVISLIIKAICAVPLINCPPGLQDGILDDYQSWINQLNSVIISCGRKHPSPLVRDYIKNACDICGIGFSSSILNSAASEYYNTVYYNAQVEKGTRDNSVKFIDQNIPIKTLKMFLDELKIGFNANYRIESGVLIFERKDYFWSGINWINYEQIKLAGRIQDNICYEWRAEEKQAGVDMTFVEDPTDWVGNEALPFYREAIGQNTPYSTLQKGLKPIAMPYGTPRFRDDGVDRDVLDTYKNVPIIGNVIKQNEGALIQNNGTSFQPKLIIWDGVSISNAKGRKFPGHTNQYNWPYQVNTESVIDNTAYPSNQPNMALYGRFHTIDHPKIINDQGKSFSFSFNYTCQELRDFEITKTILLPVGEGRISFIDIDIDEQIITVNGEV